MAAYTGTFTADGASAAPYFYPRAEFNVWIFGSGWSGTVGIERQVPGTTTWCPLTYTDGTPITWSSNLATTLSEREDGVAYRLTGTGISGTVNWRLSQ